MTTDKLTVTASNLSKAIVVVHKTKDCLRQTEKDRDEHVYLLSEHVKNEMDLHSKASQVNYNSSIIHW